MKSAIGIEYRLEVSVSQDTGEPGIGSQKKTIDSKGQVTRYG